MKKLSQVHAKFSAKGSNIDPNSACFVKVDMREEDFLAAHREFKQNIAPIFSLLSQKSFRFSLME